MDHKQTSYLSGATYATASTTAQKALTVADLERVVQMLRSMPPEPIGEWMRAQGHPPERWRVVLPNKLLEEVPGPAVWPRYVSFSQMVSSPIFLLER